mmetsp:Transcript_105386/g.302972  ORF Transcript_105386/g.302972 Transcript_105386/m.302972 type:complete len:219 (+) Transcript_105386:115-771(+)
MSGGVRTRASGGSGTSGEQTETNFRSSGSASSGAFGERQASKGELGRLEQHERRRPGPGRRHRRPRRRRRRRGRRTCCGARAGPARGGAPRRGPGLGDIAGQNQSNLVATHVRLRGHRVPDGGRLQSDHLSPIGALETVRRGCDFSSSGGRGPPIGRTRAGSRSVQPRGDASVLRPAQQVETHSGDPRMNHAPTRRPNEYATSVFNWERVAGSTAANF